MPLHLLREFLPPALSRPLARRFLGVRYVGNYASWAEAKRVTTGYDAPNILARVVESARAVRDGHAAYERDGVAFPTPSYRWPLLACLLAEAARRDGHLNVLDFGGSLGSIYFQHRALLRGLKKLRWAVVEQPAFVEAGGREFATGELSFHRSIADAVRSAAPSVALFSGVLGWVEEPHAILGEVAAAGVPAIVIDRTPLTEHAEDVAKVQRVPASIYRASYPCWFLSRTKLLARIGGAYEVRAELPQIDDAPVPGAIFGGYHLVRTAGG